MEFFVDCLEVCSLEVGFVLEVYIVVVEVVGNCFVDLEVVECEYEIEVDLYEWEFC